MRILIVDDEERNVRSTAVFLLTQGFNEVDTITDSRKVLTTLVNNESYDVILMDLYMPHLSGLSLIDPILYLYPGTKIFVVSAIDSKKSRSECMELGASKYYVKPIDNNRLVVDLKFMSKHGEAI